MVLNMSGMFAHKEPINAKFAQPKGTAAQSFIFHSTSQKSTQRLRYGKSEHVELQRSSLNGLTAVPKHACMHMPAYELPTSSSSSRTLKRAAYSVFIWNPACASGSLSLPSKSNNAFFFIFRGIVAAHLRSLFRMK